MEDKFAGVPEIYVLGTNPNGDGKSTWPNYFSKLWTKVEISVEFMIHPFPCICISLCA